MIYAPTCTPVFRSSPRPATGKQAIRGDMGRNYRLKGDVELAQLTQSMPIAESVQ